MTAAQVPGKVTREDLEAAFPWVRFLPEKAMGEFMAHVESYRGAAKVYARFKEAAERADPAKVARMMAHIDAQAAAIEAAKKPPPMPTGGFSTASALSSWHSMTTGTSSRGPLLPSRP
jgi:hypothetical protein